MTSESGKQTIAMHILANISRSKGNQTMKFDQLTNLILVFLKKSYAKCGGEAILIPFSKKSKLSISLNQKYKVLCSFMFLLHTKLRAIEIYNLK